MTFRKATATISGGCRRRKSLLEEVRRERLHPHGLVRRDVTVRELEQQLDDLPNDGRDAIRGRIHSTEFRQNAAGRKSATPGEYSPGVAVCVIR